MNEIKVINYYFLKEYFFYILSVLGYELVDLVIMFFIDS